jgi:hypothetical protein
LATSSRRSRRNPNGRDARVQISGIGLFLGDDMGEQLLEDRVPGYGVEVH